MEEAYKAQPLSATHPSGNRQIRHPLLRLHEEPRYPHSPSAFVLRPPAAPPPLPNPAPGPSHRDSNPQVARPKRPVAADPRLCKGGWAPPATQGGSNYSPALVWIIHC